MKTQVCDIQDISAFRLSEINQDNLLMTILEMGTLEVVCLVSEALPGTSWALKGESQLFQHIGEDSVRRFIFRRIISTHEGVQIVE